MKETRADTRRALLQAMGLHVVLFALMFAGLQWTRSNVAEAARGEVIEADLVDPSALSTAMRSALQRDPQQLPQPQPQPQPVDNVVVEDVPPDALPEPMLEDAVPPEPVPPAPVPEPDLIDQDRVQRDANSAEVARVNREQEQKRRQQEQVDLDATRQNEKERQRQRQLAEVTKQREQATRERLRAEMRAQQLADAKALTAGSSAKSPPPGNRGTDPALAARYAAALQAAILRNWTRPESVPFGQRCRLVIRQIPGGEVVDVKFEGACPYDELGRRSVEAAVLKASPLPYAGFEEVFDRQVNFNFEARDG